MSNTPNPQITTITLPVSQNQSIDFGKLLKKYLFHWPLFFLSLVIIIAGAYFYIKLAHPVYPINATLEFKDDDKSASGSSSKTGLKALDQISSPVIVENEIEVMQSKQIMFQVVNKLKLWVRYSKKDGMTSTDLYNRSPISFEMIKTGAPLPQEGERLTIKIKDHNYFLVIDADEKQHLFKFGQPIRNNFGTWELLQTNITDNYIGETIKLSILDPDIVTDNILAGLKVGLENKDAPFVNLAYSDQVQQRGKDILNSLMDIYNKASILDKNRKAQKTIDFIDKRLDSISKDLLSASKMLQIFKSSQGITELSLQGQTYVQNQASTLKDLSDIDAKISVVDGIESYINSQAKGSMPSTTDLSDPGLSSLMEKLSDLQLRKDQLLTTTPEKNPIFDPLNKQIATLQDGIKEKIRAIKANLIATRKNYKSLNNSYDQKIRTVPSQEVQARSLSRNEDVKEKLYTYLLQEREEISLNYASSISDAQIVDDAHAGLAKWPKPTIIYVLALVIGLALPAGLIYGRDSFDVRITNRKQIEDVVTIPILGELSYQESSTPIVISQGRGKFAIGEQFRVLRTNLYHVHNNNDSGRVTLFTSSTGGEGKSFVSANLAVTLAYASRKTIIMEMDLRKPKISATFGLPTEHPGISNFLDGEKLKLEDIIQPSGIPGLDVMGCGSILPNPSELLERTLLDELIVSLRQVYDDVIIDSPPIHLVTDALIIARVADASLYIMRQGYTQKAELEFINDIKSEKRFPKLSIIFNGIKRDKYGYGYNYDNSYYNTYTDRKKHSVGGIVKKFFSRF